MVVSSVEEHKAEMKSHAETTLNKLRNMYKVAIFQLSKEVREINFEEYMRARGLAGPPTSSSSSKLAAAAGKAKGGKAGAEGGDADMSKVIKELDKEVAQLSTASRAKKQSRRAKKTSGGYNSGVSCSTDESTTTSLGFGTGLRRSARKRVTVPATPLMTSTANSVRVRGRKGAASVMETPIQPYSAANFHGLSVITPKFNLNTPMVTRAARPEERWLVSLKGSPVCIDATMTGSAAATTATTARKRATTARKRPGQARAMARAGVDNLDNFLTVPIGGGKNLLLPMDAPGSDAAAAGRGGGKGETAAANAAVLIDLDEEAMAKVLAVRNQLNELLNMKKNSS